MFPCVAVAEISVSDLRDDRSVRSALFVYIEFKVRVILSERSE